jgi:hypothetical protein
MRKVLAGSKRLDLPAARHRVRRFQSWRHAGVRRHLRRAIHHNEISQILSTRSKSFKPIHRRKPGGGIDARPWCRGFYAAMKLRLSAWALLLDADNIDHVDLLPILLGCTDEAGRPLLGSIAKGPMLRALRRNAPDAIPAAVEALRQYWMPMRYRRPCLTSRRGVLTPVTPGESEDQAHGAPQQRASP